MYLLCSSNVSDFDMNEKQKEAIKANMETLTEVFLHSIDSFFIRLRFANVINADERAKFRRNSCPREMLIDLFELLQQKDSAWGVIIAYLTKNDQLQFAKTLSVAADEVVRQLIYNLSTR